jgi:hypothetical protein
MIHDSSSIHSPLVLGVGVRPEEYAVVACKGVNSPIAAYLPISAAEAVPGGAGVIFASTAGWVTFNSNVQSR